MPARLRPSSLGPMSGPVEVQDQVEGRTQVSFLGGEVQDLRWRERAVMALGRRAKSAREDLMLRVQQGNTLVGLGVEELRAG